MTDGKKRRPRRTKASIIENINNAAIEQIKLNGFSNVLVTDIIKLAKIEPIVFYNHYENLEAFMSEFVKKYDYWFSDILKDIKHQATHKETLNKILQHLFQELNNDSIMLELLRWEVADNNNTTIRTAILRETHILPLVKSYEDHFKEKGIDIAALTALIIGGLYYLSLHKDRSSFSGIDITNQEGFKRIFNAIDFFVEKIYENDTIYNERISIANKLKEAGISDNIIHQCVWNNKS